jgi:Protein of unknown function (DUF1553)/Protein of unknown function (DUF1549)/Planctomycete cytochrome C
MRTSLTLAATLGLMVLLPVGVRAADAVDFTRQVKPMLAERCFRCHGPEKQKSGLRLDTATAVRKGGDSGPAVVPLKSDASLLIKAVRGAEGIAAMPPKGDRLSPQQIAVLRAWIDEGAKIPVDEKVVVANKHWSFQPIVRPKNPPVKDESWLRNGIDRFILARLEKDGIKPSAEADRVTLLRRVSLDLLGLPPTPGEIDEFLADTRPDAYERQVDRLLASPHYGERWGRHWLDQARYADSNGYSIDAPRSIWKYRDWVIDAINRDKRFDQFATEQLAGDLLPSATPEQRVATGFHRNTQINQEGGIDLEQFRVESVIDRVNTTGSVFLGLTVGCAQCHNHKFDPLAQREYYQLYAFFNNVDEPTLELATPEQKEKRQALQAQITAQEKQLKTLDLGTTQRLEKWEGGLSPDAKSKLPKKIQTILAIAVNGRNAHQEQEVLTAFRNIDQTRNVVGGLANPLALVPAAHLLALTTRQSLETQIIELKHQLPVIPTTLVVQERKTPRVTTIQLGGDFLRKGPVVTPGTPAVLHPLPAKNNPNRLDLAAWLFDRRNPLTARVMMNRFWQVYFGLGLVETDNDFGTQGALPSHPELLDFLASEFEDRGWSMKAMHRLIVTSATYRQSSRARPDLLTLDPRNRLLARQNRMRLEAEVVRDVALASSGLLVPTIGGPSVFPPQPKGVYNFTQVPRDWKPSVGSDRYRRGMYTYFWRSAPHPGLIVFDAPDAGTTCTRRNRSNTPLQALTLLNDEAYVEFAQGLAERILAEAGPGDEARIGHAFRLCLGRQPRSNERQLLTRLLETQTEAFRKNPQEAKALLPANRLPGADSCRFAAWTMVARVLLNLDEFITRE